MDRLGKRRPLAKNATGAAALKRFNRCLGSIILALVGTGQFCSCQRRGIASANAAKMVLRCDCDTRLTDNLDGCGTSNYY